MGKGTRRAQSRQEDPIFLGSIVHLNEGLMGLFSQKKTSPRRDPCRQFGKGRVFGRRDMTQQFRQGRDDNGLNVTRVQALDGIDGSWPFVQVDGIDWRVRVTQGTAQPKRGSREGWNR